MKRSRAIRHIEKVLSDVRMESSEKRANRVLTALEKVIGMKPPVYWFEDGDLGSKYISEWEKE